MQLWNVKRPRTVAVRRRSSLAPFIVGIAIWIGFPTVAAYQDMASFVSGQEAEGSRWTAVVERSVAGSVHQAEMPFVDTTMTTGSVSGAGVETPGVGSVAFRTKGHTETSPDEERVNRGDKKGRIVHSAPVAPPKEFNAGTVFERTTSLLARPGDDKTAMAFVAPDIMGKEVKVASTFYVKDDRPAEPRIMPVVAELVNNDRADILATAYAPPEPDYAKESPFASILAEQDDTNGRFIPPVSEDDHPWAHTALPPLVFSDREQQCLAAGIYFEARGESVKGQAAVAQVILNRVRNPAYPGTICGVVYQNKHWRNRCQFSFACDGIRDRVASSGHFAIAEEVGMAVTAGKIWLEEVGSSTHYHATYVRPRWARTMKRMNQIGQHIFYRTYGGSWN